MEIEITASGVYDGDGKRIPVGTRLKVSKEPKGWVNKYRIVSSEEGKVFATGDTKEEDLSGLRDEYEQVLGFRPGPRMHAKTMREAIDRVRDGNDS